MVYLILLDYIQHLKHNLSYNTSLYGNSKELSLCHKLKFSVAEFKEFERRFKFRPRFKYGWFHLKLYQMFQDLSRR